MNAIVRDCDSFSKAINLEGKNPFKSPSQYVGASIN